MKKENILKKRKQFNWTFKNGEQVHEKDLVLVYTKAKSKNYKVGFSVSKKVGKAVTRNKIRRRLKAIVTKLNDQIANNNTLIFVARPSAAECLFCDLEVQVNSLLKKANLFKNYEKIS